MKLIKTYISLILITSLLIFTSCSDDNDNPTNGGTNGDKLEITSFTPGSGYIGTEVTITGKNFTTDISKLAVFFHDNVEAEIDSVYPATNPTNIICRVPEGAVTGNIKVVVDGETVTSSEEFAIMVRFQPSSENTWWSYDFYELEKNGRKENTHRRDSAVVTGTEMKFQQEAAVHQNYEDDQESEKTYFHEESEQLYSLATYVYPSPEDLGGFNIPLEVPDAWVLIADEQGTTWDIGSQDFDNIKVTVQGTELTIKGTFYVRGEKGSKEDIDVKGSMNSAQDYIITYGFDGKIKKIKIGPVPVDTDIDLKFDLQNHFYYVNNLGLVKRVLEPTTVKTGDPAPDYDIDGSESIIADYEIK